MSANVTNVVEAVRHLTPAEQREIFARLLPQQAAHDGSTVWMSIKFSDAARVVAYTPEQEPLLAELSQVLRQGVLARLENKEDGIYEIYGTDRTYLVVMTPAREFVALLSSWTPDDPPREITFPNE